MKAWMINRGSALLAGIAGSLVAGCQTAPTGAHAQATAPSPAPVTAAAALEPAALIGQYRVAGVDGASLDLPHGIAARIDGSRIEVSADCIRLAWHYTIVSGRLATQRVPVASCRRALMPQEQALADAFDAARTVHRTPANGIEFSGGERSVLLFSQ